MSHSRSLTLLVSSVSARGRALSAGRAVVEALRSGGWTVTVRVTSGGHNLAEEARALTTSYVGALGGDGYLASVAGGRVGMVQPLIPFPGGRGNDLCRYLGIGVDPAAWARRLAEATDEQLVSWTRPLDGMEVVSASRTTVALGIVSLGLDATAAQIANDSWVRSGPAAYAWGAVAAFAGRFTPVSLSAHVDGQPRELGGWITSISNTGWFGGGINLIPRSRADDGIVEIVNVQRIPRWQALPILTRALASRSIDTPVIEVTEASVISLREPVGLLALADGDEVGRLPLTISVLPGAFQVVAPQGDA